MHCALPALLGVLLSTAAIAQDGPLHLPSPDWRDQVIYFVLTDRFDDGDRSNNDQGAGEHEPADGRRYSGGDLRGITRRLDYIRGLGATAVWITPPVANQWWDGELGYGGYHGYWAQDFAALDPHAGTLADYQALSRALHGRGMYLIQDVVVNHTGNYFGYRGGFDPADPTAHYQPNPASKPSAAPTRWPFSANDPRRAEHRAAAVYHWTPVIADFSRREQELDHQLADLDDLNTESPLVRRALRQAYAGWIRDVGVDGFRIDTAFHVPPAFFTDFMQADDAEAPGIDRVARETGRAGFIAFGEGFGADRAYHDDNARKLETYVRGADGARRLDAMINFPLYGSLADVFARGRPSAELGDRIRRMLRVHADPHRMPSFVDNHDVDRFLSGGDEAGLRQALLAIMTLPGIPTLYYGTEQGFRVQRQAMFAAGHGSGGRDHFDAAAPLYRYIASITALRRAHPLLSRGTPTVLADNPAAPGALVYRVSGEGDPLYVAFNSAGHDSLLDFSDAALAPGSRLRVLFAIDPATAPTPVVGADGRVLVALPARAGLVWMVEPSDGDAPAHDEVRIEPLPATADGDLALRGDAPPNARFRLVLDGDLRAAPTVDADATGRWQAGLDTASLIDPTLVHRVQAWAAAPALRSAAQTFKVQRNWRVLADTDDPAGDDLGPNGRYRYPLDAGWTAARPADIRGLRVSASGGALSLELEMHALSAVWNPPNGFDRVAFTVFIALPQRDGGAIVMPLQNDVLPEGMRWHYRLRVGGWSNALFAADGATATAEGRPLGTASTIEVDPATRRLRFTLPAAALGDPATLSGLRVYVTSWDYDGGYRRLQPEPGGHAFGGGDGSRDPLWMDAVLLRVP